MGFAVRFAAAHLQSAQGTFGTTTMLRLERSLGLIMPIISLGGWRRLCVTYNMPLEGAQPEGTDRRRDRSAL